VVAPILIPTLVQNYTPPRNGKVYRVWFLCGNVQCAVERTIDEASNNEFTGACAGGTCLAVRPSTFLAWIVPFDVRIEIESQLLPLLVDAHCGSVEFCIIHSNKKKNDCTLI
jgi:hypothetical protein